MQWDVVAPQLPRKWKVPPRYEQGSSEAQFHSTAKDLFRQVYFEVIDLAVSSINRAGVTGPAARFWPDQYFKLQQYFFQKKN